MEENYFKSEHHIKNALNAQKKATEKASQMAQKKRESYYDNPKLCLTCVEIIDYHKRLKNNFCSSSCSATYNNKSRTHTDETKSKISAKLLGNKNGKGFKGQRKPLSNEHKRKLKDGMKKFYKEHPEAIESISKKLKGRITSEETKDKLRVIAEERIKNGTHIGWTKRAKPSYPELFFMDVLRNNGVPFLYNEPCGRYFIDFAIKNKNTALEIDGKQHLIPERVEHDKKKDTFLSHEGWNVYRIKWNSVKSDFGKEIMRNKISDFMNFYNSL